MQLDAITGIRTMIRTYSELCKLKTFEERFNYLRIGGKVGSETFGWERYFNQRFYTSKEWKQIRRDLIIRDNGFEMGLYGFPILGPIYIHHMNPINISDIEKVSSFLINPEYLICVSHKLHNSIHYGSLQIDNFIPIERSPNDTSPWKK